MKEILVIRWKSIGDVAFTLPAVNRIRDNFPDARLTFLVSKENAFVVEGFEAVDRIWTVDRAALKEGRYFAGVASFLGLLRQVRRQRFDLVVDFQGYGETALVARISGAPERWGNAKPTLRSWAYTRNYKKRRENRQIERYLFLLEEFGLVATPVRNRFRLEPQHVATAQAHLASQSIPPGKPLVYIQPCSSEPKRNWPIERFMALSDHLRSQGVHCVYGGGPREEGVLNEVKRRGFAISAGIDVRACLGLMVNSHLVVGCDTGLLHIANALGRPVLMLGPRNAPRPYGQDESALLSTDADVTRIELQMVISRVEASLKDVLRSSAFNFPSRDGQSKNA